MTPEPIHQIYRAESTMTTSSYNFYPLFLPVKLQMNPWDGLIVTNGGIFMVTEI